MKDVSCLDFLMKSNADKMSLYGESQRTSPKGPGLEAFAPLDEEHTLVWSSVMW